MIPPWKNQLPKALAVDSAHCSQTELTHDVSMPAAGVAVEFRVTPGLSVPQSRLPKVPVEQRMRSLACKESAVNGLVDEGGIFKFDQDALVLQTGHPHGFIAAATAAFAEHYPLSVRPQHFWLMILQAIAVHVGKHSEELREHWVLHEGKKELEVKCDEFCLGSRNDWASVVDGKPDCFSAQIDSNVVAGLVEELAPAFADTTSVENIALKITVMDVTKSFFSYKCSSMCGFPSVVMEGSPQDWQLLKISAESLIKNRCQNVFAENWCAALLPLLDKFAEEYAKGSSGTGDADELFWNSMCKRGGTRGSGSRTWFNGWINVFFPYIKDRPNRYATPYSADNGYVKEGRDGGQYGMRAPPDVQGPDCEDFPNGLAAAPVLWDYFGQEIPLKFKAGFIGAEQDDVTGIVKPLVGWFITHAGTDESKGKGKGKSKQSGY